MSLRYRWGLIVAALVIAAGFGWAREASTAPLSKADLETRMTVLREREAGGSKLLKLTPMEAQDLAKDLGDLWDDIQKFGKDKLNGTQVLAIKTRAEAWRDDGTYPLISLRVNRDHEQWIKDTSIEGERVLVSSSVKSEWRWRIVVSREDRSEKRMTDWIKAHAAWFLKNAPGKDFAKAEKAFQTRYKDNQLSLMAAISKGSVPGYEVHHDIPLYVGTENGGRDRGAEDGSLSPGRGNYRLIPHSEHVSTHKRGGKTYSLWGPPALYVPSDNPRKENPDTATGDQE
jgi:hypothetical protein